MKALNQTRHTLLASDLRVADHFFRRLCGLLATPVREFGPGRGLWITPSQGVHTLGMRYAIDALYLDRNLRAIHLEPGLVPWRLGAICRSAAGVLELPAGALQRTQTQIGDQIALNHAGSVRRRRRQSGQTMVLVVLALAVLLGIAGLGADVGVARVEQTRLQAVADAAAIAGASNIPSNNVLAGAQSAATLNGFSSGSGGDTLTVNHPPRSGPHAGDAAYIEVIASRQQPTFFANVFGIASLTPSARAVAHLGNGAGCIYVLDPYAADALQLNGSFDIQMQCALYIDSDSSIALLANGSGTLSASAIGVAGGALINGSISVQPSLTEGMIPLNDPLASLPVPSASGSCSTTTIVNGTGDATLNPGLYCAPLIINGSPTVTFNPGVYFLQAGIIMNGSPTLLGAGVTLYNSAGAFTLNGSAATELSAPTTGPYAGILVFQARSNLLPLTINGNQSVLNGAVYAPTARIVDNGSLSGSSSYSIFVGGTVTINGSADFNDDFSSLPGGSPIKAAALVG
ncbi:MAG: DUF192 domain-containing protein [Terriglobales bacterium]